MKIKPITYKEASNYVNENHRHHNASQGCKFCISAVNDTGGVVGVAMCGRPVARHLDDGLTLEINRVCTDGTRNACSKLYGACIRIAKDMGYEKVITYILESEDGASVKAANFIFDGTVCGALWKNRKSKSNSVSAIPKKRFVYKIS